jgi:hypothetical protein
MGDSYHACLRVKGKINQQYNALHEALHVVVDLLEPVVDGKRTG